ncbi:putative inorganic carbon transporter subunit DabA OS=Castellaniella defragrans OX=75697 GN=dabA PE=3 SV=1 [Castellaniella defragrans]
MSAAVMSAVSADGLAPEAAGLDDRALQGAVRRACSHIMPAWPLDQAVAVNPHWRRIGLPIRRVAARLAVLGDFPGVPRQGLHSAGVGSGSYLA